MGADKDNAEITDEMVKEAETAMWDEVSKLGIEGIDEMPLSVIRLMIAAALSKNRKA